MARGLMVVQKSAEDALAQKCGIPVAGHLSSGGEGIGRSGIWRRDSRSQERHHDGIFLRKQITVAQRLGELACTKLGRLHVRDR